jgi:hypothetical protein
MAHQLCGLVLTVDARPLKDPCNKVDQSKLRPKHISGPPEVEISIGAYMPVNSGSSL